MNEIFSDEAEKISMQSVTVRVISARRRGFQKFLTVLLIITWLIMLRRKFTWKSKGEQAKIL